MLLKGKKKTWYQKIFPNFILEWFGWEFHDGFVKISTAGYRFKRRDD